MKQELKEKTFEYLKQKKGYINIKQILKDTGIELKVLLEILEELEENYEVIKTKNRKYATTSYIHGVLSVKKTGYGFVRGDNIGDIFISKSNMLNAIDGDNVVVEIIDYANNKGRIKRIISHKDREVGEVVISNDKKYVLIKNSRKNIKVLLPKEATNQLVEGHIVSLKVGSLIKNNTYDGQIIQIIGHKNNPGIDILSIAAELGIPLEFSDEAIEEANQLPTEVSKDDFYGRKDLRKELVFTIDGKDTKDIDDGFSFRIKENGNIEISIHIMDVSHYIKEGSALDKEAYRRATSYYSANTVLPMLLSLLSNGICSLNEGEDRLAVSTIIEFDKNYNMIDFDIDLTVVNSKKKMDYETVDLCLQDMNTDQTYEQFIPALKELYQCALVLRDKRLKKGSLNFESREIKIIVDEHGKAIDVKRVKDPISSTIVEEFMILDNVLIATVLTNLKVPLQYRVHGMPNKDKLKEAMNFIKIVSKKTKTFPKKNQSVLLKQILDDLKDDPEYSSICSFILRCLPKACYDDLNIGHFGLAIDIYTHFTSPIRRYPDLFNHRQLKKALKLKYTKLDKSYFPVSNLRQKAEHCSYMEKTADEFERRVTKMKSAEYMEDYIGKTYSGRVTGVNQMGIYVDVYNGIEGLIRLNDLKRGLFNSEKYVITSSDGFFRIGSEVEVQIESVDKEARQIYLTFVKKLDKTKKL